MPEVIIRPAKPGDAPAVAAFAQPVYEQVYPNAKYGLKPEHFSRAIFDTSDTLEYFAGVLAITERQQAWVAEAGGRIVGCISIDRQPDFYEVHAFYVSLHWQKLGIGKRLLAAALNVVPGNVPVRVEVAETNTESIALYRRWGFQPAPQYGTKLRHWPEWPEGLVNGYVFMEARRADLKI